MVLSSCSIIPFLALLGATPLVSGRTLGNIFHPRQANDTNFKCEWPAGWTSCNSETNRGCWVKDPSGKEYGIGTDYEDEWPTGTTRKVYLEIGEATVSPDGFTKNLAQTINGTYPGPLIEACWGDTIEVTVKNTINKNGTTIHWHGLRMFHENHMDGVNGVTQCPIPNGDTFTYKFHVKQYGHTWYHSHYSSQYSDGVAAPLLIHGPHTAQWEEKWNKPIIVADWYHENAYKAFEASLGGVNPQADSIVVDGIGRNNKDNTGQFFERTFKRDKKHLIRVINGGTDFHFHFSIDNHVLQVVAADMVPITPFFTTSLSVAIGQRYSIIVHANATAAANGRYWMRTQYAAACGLVHNNFPFNAPDTHRVGVISYDDATGTDLPTTTGTTDAVTCRDPTFTPNITWTIPQPPADILKNAPQHWAGRDNVVGHQRHGAFRWELAPEPLWLNFADPTIMNLKNETFNPEYAVEPYNGDNPEGFVYMIINSGNATQGAMFAGAHPIHLHGHDFAVISQQNTRFDPNNPPQFNLVNPPRRDVAILPNNGHLVLAFKTDNPGVWLIHCHIAWHAGSGLALQVLENKDKIQDTIGGSLAPVEEGCKKWTNWLDAHPDAKAEIVDHQEDSGI